MPGERASLAIILAELPGGPETIRLRMNAFDILGSLQPGAPISVRITSDGDHKRILALQQRDGQPWDLLPETCAIVMRINQQKKVTSLLLVSGETSLAHHDNIHEAANLHAGDFVYARSAPGRDVMHARTIRPCKEPETSAYWKSFEGNFRPREQGGGHAGDVFIPPYLADGFTAGCQVQGIAARQSGDRGDSWWSAVSARKL